MRRRSFWIVLATMLVTIVLLSVQLYRTSKRLDKAERYMTSGMHAWVGACGYLARSFVGENWIRAKATAEQARNHCLGEDEWPAFDALVEKGHFEQASALMSKRIYSHHLPRLVQEGSYASSTFPAGYP